MVKRRAVCTYPLHHDAPRVRPAETSTKPGPHSPRQAPDAKSPEVQNDKSSELYKVPEHHGKDGNVIAASGKLATVPTTTGPANGQKTPSLYKQQQQQQQQQQHLRDLVRELHELRDQPLVLAELAPFAPPGATLEDITGQNERTSSGKSSPMGEGRSPAASSSHRGGRGRSRSWSHADPASRDGQSSLSPSRRAKAKEKTAELVSRWLSSRSGASSRSRSWSGFLDTAAAGGSSIGGGSWSSFERLDVHAHGAGRRGSRSGSRQLNRVKQPRHSGSGSGATAGGDNKSQGPNPHPQSTDSTSTSRVTARSSKWTQAGSTTPSSGAAVFHRTDGSYDGSPMAGTAATTTATTVGTIVTSSAFAAADVTSVTGTSGHQHGSRSSLPHLQATEHQVITRREYGGPSSNTTKKQRKAYVEHATGIRDRDGDAGGSDRRAQAGRTPGILSPTSAGVTSTPDAERGQNMRVSSMGLSTDNRTGRSRIEAGGSCSEASCGSIGIDEEEVEGEDEASFTDPEELEEHRKFLAALAKFRVANVPAAALEQDGWGSPGSEADRASDRASESANDAPSPPANGTRSNYPDREEHPKPAKETISGLQKNGLTAGDTQGLLPTAQDAGMKLPPADMKLPPEQSVPTTGNEEPLGRAPSFQSATVDAQMRPSNTPSPAVVPGADRGMLTRAAVQARLASATETSQVVPIPTRRVYSHSELEPADHLAAAAHRSKAWLKSRGIAGSDRSVGRKGTGTERRGDQADDEHGSSVSKRTGHGRRSRRASAWGSDDGDGDGGDSADDEARSANTQPVSLAQDSGGARDTTQKRAVLQPKGSMRLMQRVSQRRQSEDAAGLGMLSSMHGLSPTRRKSSLGESSGLFSYMDKEATYRTPGTNPPVERPADGVLPHVGRDRSIRLEYSSVSRSGSAASRAGTGVGSAPNAANPADGGTGNASGGEGNHGNRIEVVNQHGEIHGFSGCSLSDLLAQSGDGAAGIEARGDPMPHGKEAPSKSDAKAKQMKHGGEPGASGSGDLREGAAESTSRAMRDVSVGDVPSLEARVATLKQYRRRGVMMKEQAERGGRVDGDWEGGDEDESGLSGSSSWGMS